MTRESRLLKINYYVDKQKLFVQEIQSKQLISNLFKFIIGAGNLSNKKFLMKYNNISILEEDKVKTLNEYFPKNQDEINLQIEEIKIKSIQETIPARCNESGSNNCKIHNYKFLYLYCYDCQKSICLICSKEGHLNHNIMDKHDYLQHSEYLVNSLLMNLDFTVNEVIESKENNLDKLKSRVSDELIPSVINEVRNMEKKILDLINYYSETQRKSKNNVRVNFFDLKDTLVNALEEFKHQISIKDVTRDEDVFRTFDEKIRSINFETEKLLHMERFNDLGKISFNISANTEVIYSNLKSYLESQINNQYFEHIKNELDSCRIDKLSDDQLINLLFKIKGETSKLNIGGAAKNLNEEKSVGNKNFGEIFIRAKNFNQALNNNLDKKMNESGNNSNQAYPLQQKIEELKNSVLNKIDLKNFNEEERSEAESLIKMKVLSGLMQQNNSKIDNLFESIVDSISCEIMGNLDTFLEKVREDRRILQNLIQEKISRLRDSQMKSNINNNLDKSVENEIKASALKQFQQMTDLEKRINLIKNEIINEAKKSGKVLSEDDLSKISDSIKEKLINEKVMEEILNEILSATSKSGEEKSKIQKKIKIVLNNKADLLSIDNQIIDEKKRRENIFKEIAENSESLGLKKINQNDQNDLESKIASTLKIQELKEELEKAVLIKGYPLTEQEKKSIEKKCNENRDLKEKAKRDILDKYQLSQTENFIKKNLNEVAQNKSKLGEFQNSLPQNNSNVNQFQNSLPQNNSNVNQFQNSLPQNSSNVNQFQNASPQNKNRSNVNEFQNASGQNRSNVNEFQNSLPQNKSNVNVFQNSLPKISSNFNELQNASSQNKSNFNELQNASAQNKSNVNELQNVSPQNKSNVNEFQNVSAQNKSNVNEFQNSLPQNKSKLGEFQNSLPQNSSNLNQFQNASPQNKSNVNEFQNSLPQNSSNVNQFQNSSPQNKSNVDQFKNASGQNNSNVNEFQNSLPQNRSKLGEFQNASAQNRSNVNELQNASPQNKSNFNEFQNSLPQNKSNFNEFQNASAQNKSNVNELQNASPQNKSNFNEFQNASAQNKSKLNELQNASAQNKSNVIELQNASSQNKSNVNELQNALNSDKNIKNKMDIDQAESEIQDIKEDNNGNEFDNLESPQDEPEDEKMVDEGEDETGLQNKETSDINVPVPIAKNAGESISQKSDKNGNPIKNTPQNIVNNSDDFEMSEALPDNVQTDSNKISNKDLKTPNSKINLSPNPGIKVIGVNSNSQTKNNEKKIQENILENKNENSENTSNPNATNDSKVYRSLKNQNQKTSDSIKPEFSLQLNQLNNQDSIPLKQKIFTESGKVDSLKNNNSFSAKNSRSAENITTDEVLKESRLNSNNNINEFSSSAKVMKCLPGSNQILIYDENYEYTIEKKELNITKDVIGADQNAFTPGCSWVSVKNCLYISGGELNSKPSNSLYSYDYTLDKFLRLKNLINSRSYHSTISDTKYLYIIGGKDTKKCEKYNIQRQTIEEMADLKAGPRKTPLLHIHDNSFLYCFFGLKQNEVFNETIERIDIRSNKGSWNIVAFTNPSSVNIYRLNCGLVEKGDRLIFVGGNYNNEKIKQSIFFDFKNNTFGDQNHQNDEEDTTFFDNKLRPLADDYYGNFDTKMNFVKFKFE